MLPLSHVFCRDAERIAAVALRQPRINKAPSQRGVVQLYPLIERRFALAQHIGRAAHAFHAAGQNQFAKAAADFCRGVDPLTPWANKPEPFNCVAKNATDS